MKPADVNSSPYIDFNKENNNDEPKFKVGDHARISEYKKCFAKGFVPNWSEEVFVIKKVKNTVPQTYVISNLDSEKIVRTFTKKHCKKIKKKRVQSCKSNKEKRQRLQQSIQQLD